MDSTTLLHLITTVLDEKKAQQIVTLDVRDKTTVTDYMVVTTGTASRHLMALSQYVIEALAGRGIKPLGVEGELGSDWVLLDVGDVIVHLMTEQAREYYQLEKLWSVPTAPAVEQHIA